MPQRRAWLARSNATLQDEGKLAPRRNPPPAQPAAVETRSLVEMPIMSKGPLHAHHRADGAAGDYAVQMGASGRGKVRGMA
jgi:hypothetical protein